MAGCKHEKEHTRLFSGLLKHELCPTDVAALMQALLAMANAEVGRQIMNRHWHLDMLGISQYDVAVDSMARLFACNTTSPCERFRQSLAAMRAGSEHTAPLCRYVHGIIGRQVRQEFSRILTANDSMHAKLQRALRRHEMSTPDLTFREACGVRVYGVAGTDVLIAQPFMSFEELSYGIAYRASPDDDRDARSKGGRPPNPAVLVLTACLHLLASQEIYRREVHEHDVLLLTKIMLADAYESMHEDSCECIPPGSAENELHVRIATAIEATRAWAEAPYANACTHYHQRSTLCIIQASSL